MPFVLLWALTLTPAPSVRAQAALAEACGECHDPARGGDEGGFDFLLDREGLVGAKLVTPGDARVSKLLQRVELGEMPPPEALTKRTPAQRRALRSEVQAALRAWIAAGAPAEGFTAATPRDDWRFVPREELEQAMERDLNRLPSADRRFVRYFSLLEVHDARANVGAHAVALAKALNSLSWRPRLVTPARVDATGLLLRVDLRELGWPVERWDALLAGLYPWGVASGSFAFERASEETRSRLPLVRADWFLAEALRPPLYHALLGLPSSEQGLEALLHVDAARDLEQGRVQRAGFNGSGISQNNRVIERHPSRFGGYWKSYDFSGNAGVQNIFARPLGPGHGARAFVHAGGEFIFPLPNGLFGFLLADSSGRRLDKAPSAIVRDAGRPDGAVENGLSCLGCHARGLIPKEDQVREAVLEDPAGFGAADVERVKALYPPAAVLAASLEADNRPLLAANTALGLAAEGPDPLTAAVARYEAELDLRTAAAELGLLPGELLSALPRLGTRGGALAPLRLAHGRVKRDAFTALFGELVTRLGLGAPLRLSALELSPRSTCGAEPDTVDERVEDCARGFADLRTGDGQPLARRTVGDGAWSLVTQDARGAQVWRDERSGGLWARAGHGVTQRAAVEVCARLALLEQPWSLPLARELMAADASGLPLSGGERWSQDVDHSEKYHSGGVVVGSAGPRVVEGSAAAEVVCLSRAAASR